MLWQREWDGVLCIGAIRVWQGRFLVFWTLDGWTGWRTSCCCKLVPPARQPSPPWPASSLPHLDAQRCLVRPTCEGHGGISLAGITQVTPLRVNDDAGQHGCVAAMVGYCYSISRHRMLLWSRAVALLIVLLVLPVVTHCNCALLLRPSRTG